MEAQAMERPLVEEDLANAGFNEKQIEDLVQLKQRNVERNVEFQYSDSRVQHWMFLRWLLLTGRLDNDGSAYSSGGLTLGG